jgi:hypothetical protein
MRIGGPIEGRIVMHDDNAVTREMDIEFEPIRAERKAVIEGDDRVFGAKDRSAAVGIYERARGRAQGAYCNMPYDLGTSPHTW